MLRPLLAATMVLFAVACSDDGPLDRPVSKPAFVPEEVEVKYQEREALRYAIDQLKQEEQANTEAQAMSETPGGTGSDKP